MDIIRISNNQGFEMDSFTLVAINKERKAQYKRFFLLYFNKKSREWEWQLSSDACCGTWRVFTFHGEGWRGNIKLY